MDDKQHDTLCENIERSCRKIERLGEIIRLATINTNDPIWLYLHSEGRAAEPKRLSRHQLLSTYRQYYVAEIEYWEARQAFEVAACGKPAPVLDRELDEAKKRLYRTSGIIERVGDSLLEKVSE